MLSIKDYLNHKNYQFKHRGNEIVMNCPFCKDGDTEKKFSINSQTGAWRCFHLNKCGLKGSWKEFQERHNDKPEGLYGSIFYTENQKTYKKPKDKLGEINDKVKVYINSRGISDQTIKRFKVTSQGEDIITFPYYKNKTLVNIKYRSTADKTKMWTEKEAENVLFGRDLIQDDSSLIICEGEFDAMALWEYEIEAVSVPMGAGNHEWLSNEWDFIDNFRTVYLVFDTDVVGIKAAKDIAAKIGTWKCRLVELPHKDANECLIKKVTKEEMLGCVFSAVELQPAYLVQAEDFRQDVHNLFLKGTSLFGEKTAWRGLDDLLKGWRECELTIWSGRNSSGKSTILNQHFLHMIDQNINCCVASLEMPPARYLRWAVIQKKQNANPSPSAIDDCFDWFAGKFYILNWYDRLESKYIMECFEYAARRYNCKHFILDSLMKIKLAGKNEYDAQADFLSELKGFAEKYKTHVHLVVHPRKGEKDSDVPGKVDVKGSSHITDIADNVITLQRLDDDEKLAATKRGKPADMMLFVRKNREFGTEGGLRMSFNEQTKRFTDA
ncbi:MAG TPA: bifunctional DNA primase/helicase [Candidatus Wunengus sp. YC61]|uniref:bifunctional DNA primase/helicase n=1 Tax=Candidatus Wunengus sp. YC61 TaxID=3367698 RepID=UPI0040281F41